MTNAVALRRSGLILTSVTVMLAVWISGSRHSPSRRILASACRSSSPTRSWRWLVFPSTPAPRGDCGRPRRFLVIFQFYSVTPYRRCSGAGNALQSTRHFLDFKTLDDVAHLDIVIILESHAALVALIDLADFVLETLQGLQRAFVNDDVIAQQSDLGAASDGAFRNHTTGDFSDPGDVEYLADRGVAE